MGHRSSLLYGHRNGHTVHSSHWGAYKAELLDDISEATPFGSKNMEPDYLNALVSSLEKMTEDSDMEFEGKLAEKQDTTPVNPEPYAVIDETDLSKAFMEWGANHIDPIFHECVYVIDTVASPWTIEAHAPIYWRNSPSYQEAREKGDVEAVPPYALVNAGEDSHDEWGGREADSYEEFKNSLLRDFDNHQIHLF